MVLDEGRNREIRRVLASVGHKVAATRRASPSARCGWARWARPVAPLTHAEIEALRRRTQVEATKRLSGKIAYAAASAWEHPGPTRTRSSEQVKTRIAIPSDLMS